MSTIKKQILFDGAFGSYYAKLTGKENNFELANINDSSTVLQIHQEYIRAGAQAIKTNTFGANTTSLGIPFEEVKEIIKAGLELAQKAAAHSDISVFADIGPISTDYSNESVLSGDLNNHFGAKNEQAIEEYKKIIDVFLESGATNFLFETFSEYESLAEAVLYLKQKKPQAFAAVSFAVDQEGYTRKGLYYKDLAVKSKLNKSFDSFGFNCICGPAHMCNLVSKLALDDETISAMPNAGYPSIVGGRIIYIDNAEYFGKKLLELSDMGVSILGGCCGTTPEHIKAAAKLFFNHTAISKSTFYHNDVLSVKTAKHNNFEEKLSSRKKVIAVELDPPIDLNFSALLGGSNAVKEAGADIVTLADSPLARARADSMMMAAKLQRESGITVMPHFTCRDKNQIGIKASLMAGAIEGIQNLLVITGDPIVQTERTEVKGVFSLNSFKLLNYVQSLNNDVFLNAGFFQGAALNVNVTDFKQELKRALLKIENGAKFFLTQPVFGENAIQNLKTAGEALSVPILAGILPLASYKNAVFINNEVPGIQIPQVLVDELKDKDQNQTEKISVAYCLDIAKKVADYCDGYYLITPLKRTAMVCKLIKEIKNID
jgi:methionine synthase I (cobalamin-dependent)/5,10-methylenetetrahydrofolate reductase